ncbi:Bidirectional sugar transporter SWEET [Rhynchospora pubera]|uniref:Bidirectional sugar transporter SWEET n=1 Tax=Rhynchospora pubera TaxID=906938 RepID=A0AAV8DAL9_9POAL|nr:Bidirectional sugar transporter SWEET [Rhynchospora pubera]KAJ4817218.1 Bidirectional sugar transporter SWEET [Rhynchospora pubera]
MVDASFIVGIIGNVISILVFASPIGTFWRIVKNKSTEEFKWLPYVATLLSTSLWSFYGILKPDGLLILTVNGAGAVLEAIYVIIFLIYAPKKTKLSMIKMVAAVNIGFLALVVFITLFVLHGSIRLLVVGVLCAALTIGMYASPMAAMTTVIKTKSVEYMPFSLSFFLFLNGGIWSIYSVLVKDYFIGVPNALGFALGSAQLIIYFMYRGQTVPGKTQETDEEQGSGHLIGKVEMAETGHLPKASSLPKQPLSRQDSAVKIIKAFSMPPLELQSFWNQRDFTEQIGQKNAISK